MSTPPPSRRAQASRKVIRRRRIVALVLLVSFVALVVWAVTAVVNLVAGWLGLTPTGSPAPTNAVGQVCASGDVSVEAHVGDINRTEKEAFAIGENPYLWFTVTNVGQVACTFDVGAAVQFYTIKSGTDMIWTSRECDRAGLTNQVISLEPNVAQNSVPSAWLKVRSSATGCGADQTAVDAGAYNVSVEVNGVLSQSNQFLLQ